MKLASYLLLFFLLQMFNAKKTTRRLKKGIRIPLIYSHSRTYKNKGSPSTRNAAIELTKEGALVTNLTLRSSIPNWFYFSFDSIISHSWVYSDSYDWCDPNWFTLQDSHQTHVPYAVEKTEKQGFFQNKIGWVFGYWSRNVSIRIPPSNPNHDNYYFKMNFLEVQRASKGILAQQYDGVIGFAPGSPIWQLCDKMNRTQSITVILPAISNRTQPGELLLCDTPRFPADFNAFLSTTGHDRWEVKFDKILWTYHGRPDIADTLGTDAKVLFDITSPFIYIPEKAFPPITFRAQTIPLEDGSQALLECQDKYPLLPLLKFVFGEYTLFLTGNDYVQRKIYPDNTIKCIILIKTKKNNQDWIMGDIFMRKYSTTFHNNDGKIEVTEIDRKSGARK